MSAISESDSASGLLAEPVFPCCHATDAALKAASLSLPRVPLRALADAVLRDEPHLSIPFSTVPSYVAS